jgi:predicted sulfurtransferase
MNCDTYRVKWWDFTSQYYWELKKAIKDEIVWMNRSENLQKMINVFINIDSHQWKQQMKWSEH